ncbi:hypothetical protein SAY86_013050 [Trapa natans]|uniref:Uncharacterized protein n=1 Tax=Trapa natans TaxID=22666 RepID=A0AAN7LXR3_TRANT|nr:hypothetical protein SAY86_013050 [Trapa natans]
MDDASSPVGWQGRNLAAKNLLEHDIRRNGSPREPVCCSVYSEEDDDVDYLYFLKHIVEVLKPDSRHHESEAKSGNANYPDQQLQSFLKHLKKDGKFYTLVVKGSSGQRDYKYEIQDVLFEEHTHSKRPKLINLGVSKRKGCVASDTKSRKLLRNENMAEQDGKLARKREDFVRKPSRPREINCLEKTVEESQLWDESYLVFMHHIKINGEFMIFNHVGGMVRYGEDEDVESSSLDLEILSQEDILKNKENPFVTSRMTRINLEAGDLRVNEHSDFRIKLLEYLKMPYNAEEYKELWKKVRHKRLQEIVKHLRGGRERTYTTNIPCESYLEKYPDLAGKISSAKGDQLRILNLLRGFFFYLSNLPMEGVFRPWEDTSCLLILPPLPHPVKQTPSLKVEPSESLQSDSAKVVKQIQQMKEELS